MANSNISGGHIIAKLDHEVCMVLLAALASLRINFGYQKTLGFITGSQSPFIFKYHLQKNPYYGCLTAFKKELLQLVLGSLETQGFVQVDRGGPIETQVVAVTELGKKALNQGNHVLISGVLSEPPVDINDKTLYNMLSTLRDQMAKECNLPAFRICSHKVLIQIANTKPKSKTELIEIKGIGQIFVEKYGDGFLETIWKHHAAVRLNKRLFYLAPIEHLRSILLYGILSRNVVTNKGLLKVDVSDPEVQDRRKTKNVEMSDSTYKNAHDLVPLYYCTKTASNIKMQQKHKKLVLLNLGTKLVLSPEIVYAISDGNLACNNTQTYSSFEHLDKLNWRVLETCRPGYEWQKDRRQMMAELLIYRSVNANMIERIIVPSRQLESEVRPLLADYPYQIEIDIDKQVFS